MHCHSGAAVNGWRRMALLIGLVAVCVVPTEPVQEVRRHFADSSGATHLNQTERFRRLIPYMRFYVPSNEHFAVNQAYSYAPTNGQKPAAARPTQQQSHEYQQPPQLPDPYHQQQHQLQQPIRQVIRLALPQTAGRPQPHQHTQSSASASGESSQFNYEPQQQHAPAGNPGVAYKEHHRPAVQSNRGGGAFAEGASQVSHARPASGEPAQRINYNRPHQYLPSTAQTQYDKQQHILTPFLATNQVPGDFRPVQFDEHQVHQPQNVQPIQYERQPDQQPPHPTRRPVQQPTSPRPQSRFYYKTYPTEEVQDNTYVTPSNLVQFVKPTQPPTPQEHHVHHQAAPNAQPLRQPRPSPISHQQQGPIHAYPLTYQPTSSGEDQSQHSPNSLLDSRYYSPYDYSIELDPDDGYGAKVPMHSMRPPIASHGRYAGFSDNPTTSTPIIASPTPFHAPVPKVQPHHQRPFEHQPYSYEHIAKKPSFRPTMPTTTVHQHLTETTHIHAPSEPTFVHSQEQDIDYLPRPSSKSPEHPSAPRTPIPRPEYYPPGPQYDSRHPDFQNILNKLQHSQLLPQKLNSANMDGSIKALIDILNHLKQSNHVSEIPSQHVGDVAPHQVDGSIEQGHEYYAPNVVQVPPPQHHPVPVYVPPKNTHSAPPPSGEEDTDDYYDDTSSKEHSGSAPGGEPGPNTGRPGVDYPALSEIPATSFNCKEQRYKGFFGDPETHCQVWHYCDLNGGQASFLCPNGTIFSQVALTCDWWFNVKCSTTTQLYVLNERLYKYILPFSPKFPEDYSGPVVDKYLAMKYAEMEEKMRREKLKGKEHTESVDEPSDKIPATSESSENHAAETEATPAVDANAAQIDEEGQSHNVDSAIQYVDESDTIDPPRPSATPPPEYASEENVEIVSSSTDHALAKQQQQQQPGEYREQRAQQIIVAEEEDDEDDGGHVAEKNSAPQDHPKEPTTYDSSTAVPAASRYPPSRPSAVNIETERLNLIEIKTDGSTGHLIPAQYQ